MRLTTFVFIRSLLNESNRAQTFAAEIKLQEWIAYKTESYIESPINMLTNSYSEAVKKHGAQKVSYVIKIHKSLIEVSCVNFELDFLLENSSFAFLVDY